LLHSVRVLVASLRMPGIKRQRSGQRRALQLAEDSGSGGGVLGGVLGSAHAKAKRRKPPPPDPPTAPPPRPMGRGQRQRLQAATHQPERKPWPKRTSRKQLSRTARAQLKAQEAAGRKPSALLKERQPTDTHSVDQVTLTMRYHLINTFSFFNLYFQLYFVAYVPNEHTPRI
jgi:hypothetical protein